MSDSVEALLERAHAKAREIDAAVAGYRNSSPPPSTPTTGSVSSPRRPPAGPDTGALDAMTAAERETFARYLDTAGPVR